MSDQAESIHDTSSVSHFLWEITLDWTDYTSVNIRAQACVSLCTYGRHRASQSPDALGLWAPRLASCPASLPPSRCPGGPHSKESHRAHGRRSLSPCWICWMSGHRQATRLAAVPTVSRKRPSLQGLLLWRDCEVTPESVAAQGPPAGGYSTRLPVPPSQIGDVGKTGQTQTGVRPQGA